MPLLFVYGSLRKRSGNPYAEMLEREAGWLGAASMAAEVRMVGQYSGLKTGGDALIEGELWDMPDALWPALDDYEGSEYRRALSMAALGGGEIRECWVYEYAPDWT